MFLIKTFILGLCIIVCSTTLIQNDEPYSPDHSALPLLPLFVGRGYHILYGNPQSSSNTDPGFLEQVFEFSYLKNYTTSDKRYLVPDQAITQEIDSCSLATTVNSIRGSKSYQGNLQKQSKIANQSRLFDYRFSFSQNYGKFQNLTLAYNEIVNCEAVCEYNQLILNKNEFPKFSMSFVKSAIHAQQISNWAGFIATYGTHYAYDVMMGGRINKETVYSYQGASAMRGNQFDISLVAQASFAKFFNDSTFDYKKYQNAIKYSQQNLSQELYLYKGPIPISGNKTDWLESIRNDSTAITYKLAPISDLLALIKDPSFDSKSALSQFNSWMDNECVKFNCRAARDDFAPAPAAKSEVYKSSVYGNSSHGGTTFNDFVNSTITQEIRQIYACFSGDYFYALKLFISDGINERWTTMGGKCTGNYDFWKVPSGEYVSKIWMKYTSYMRSVRFVTNKGTESQIFGKNEGTYKQITISNNQRFVGLTGAYSVHLNTLGFFIAKTTYPPTPSNTNQSLELKFQ